MVSIPLAFLVHVEFKNVRVWSCESLSFRSYLDLSNLRTRFFSYRLPSLVISCHPPSSTVLSRSRQTRRVLIPLQWHRRNYLCPRILLLPRPLGRSCFDALAPAPSHHLRQSDCSCGLLPTMAFPLLYHPQLHKEVHICYYPATRHG